MKPVRRFSLMCSTAAACLLAPSLAHAQLDIQVMPTEEFSLRSVLNAPLIRFLAEGATLRAETRRSTEVILFVARASNGKLVEQGRTGPFRLDAKAASSSSGMPLGSALSEEQILSLPPLSGFSDAIVQSLATAQESISASRLLEQPGDALMIPALDGSSKELVAKQQQGDLVVIAAIPADPAVRERARTRPLFVVIAGGDL